MNQMLYVNSNDDIHGRISVLYKNNLVFCIELRFPKYNVHDQEKKRVMQKKGSYRTNFKTREEERLRYLEKFIHA